MSPSGLEDGLEGGGRTPPTGSSIPVGASSLTTWSKKMHCIKKITDDLVWVGANDRRLALFEGVYSVPTGVSYNSYLLTDEKTVLFDTVDKAVRQRFLENIEEALKGKKLDYLVVQHVEPDHSAVIPELIRQYPELKIVCSERG